MSATSLPALFPTHRWIGILESGYWLCHPRAVSLRENGCDPACFGCSARIAFDDLPRAPRRVPQLAIPIAPRADLYGQEVDLRLDIRHEELRLHARDKKRRTDAA